MIVPEKNRFELWYIDWKQCSICSEDEVNIMETGFLSWPMIRYKREVLFGWVDLLGNQF